MGRGNVTSNRSEGVSLTHRPSRPIPFKKLSQLLREIDGSQDHQPLGGLLNL